MTDVVQTATATGQQAPVLWGPDGNPISTAGAMITPNALNFAQILQMPGRLYSFRWDEAMRDNPQNAIAMKRDSFYLSLLQERWAPTINMDWQCEVDNADDPKQVLVRDGMNRVWRETPDKINLIGWLLQAGWYGRSGQQGVWGKQATGQTGWVSHEPVNGDGIQFTWDGTPVVLVSWFTAQKYLKTDPAAVITMSDRGAYGIRLYKPEYRRRYVIHKHAREAADYFEGEMAGGVHGVGIRSWVYWSGWMRTEILSWMVSFMQSTGMMDLLIFNYADGNAEALKKQQANAKLISGKLVLLVPRDPKEKFQAVEQLQMNTAGVEVLKNLVTDYYDRNIERLIVGQSMSAGGGAGGGLEGDGRAEFAKDTKYQLCKTDALRLAETLTTDYIAPAKEFNFPWADFPVRLVPILRDPNDEKKFERGMSLVQAGIEIVEEEILKAAGFSTPKPGQKTVGKKPDPAAAPPGGGPGGPVARPGDGEPASPWADPDEKADPFERMLAVYRAEQPPWPGAVFDESKHRWVNPNKGGMGSDRAAPGKPEPSGSGRATEGGDPPLLDDETELLNGVMGDVASSPDVKASPKAAAKLRQRVQHAFTLAQRVVYDVALRSPQILGAWGDLFDTPDDLKKIGYNPGFSGVGGHATGDPVKDALGVPAHMAAGLVCKVAGAAISWAKRKLKGQSRDEQQAEFEKWARAKYGDKEFERAKNWKGDTSSASQNANFWGYAGEPGESAAHMAALLKHLMDTVCEGLGVPPNPIPLDKLAANLDRLRAEKGGADQYELTPYRLSEPPFPGGVFNEQTHRWEKPGEAALTGRATRTDRAPAPASGGRSGPPPRQVKPKEKSKGLRAAGRFTTVAVRRRVIKGVKNEGELAEAIGGHNFPDSEPADVVHLLDAAGNPVKDGEAVRHALRQRERAIAYIKDENESKERKEWANKVLAQPAHFFEVKTLLVAASGKVRMSRAAQRRKERWMEKYHVAFHTVIMDDRRGSKNSGHRVYVAPWQIAGTTSVAECKPVGSLAAVLTHVTGA